jgi:hypothetical protein
MRNETLLTTRSVPEEVGRKKSSEPAIVLALFLMIAGATVSHAQTAGRTAAATQNGHGSDEAVDYQAARESFEQALRTMIPLQRPISASASSTFICATIAMPSVNLRGR